LFCANEVFFPSSSFSVLTCLLRICHLLEIWIQDYPHDFAVRGTAGALSALIKSIIAKTYLLHYGSDFLPFLEVLPSLVDKDAAWAMKPDDIADESDDLYNLCEDDDDITPITEIGSSDSNGTSPASIRGAPILSGASREHRSNLPQNAKGLTAPHMSLTLTSNQPDSWDLSMKQLCRELVKVAHEVNALDSDEIAQEITRMRVKSFLDIEVMINSIIIVFVSLSFEIHFSASTLASVYLCSWEKGPANGYYCWLQRCVKPSWRLVSLPR